VIQNEKNYKHALSRYVLAGAPAMRGLSKEQYIQKYQSLWERCNTDQVYKIKFIIEPLVDKSFAENSDDIYCVLVARADPNGELIDAPSGYHRSDEQGIFLSEIVIGTPHGVDTKRPKKPKVETYLFAYFDILGFKNKVKSEKLNILLDLYRKFLDEAVKPQQKTWSKSLARTSDGGSVPALMWTPIEAAYVSDSVILYVPYYPIYVEEFLRRSAMLFCLALRAKMPLRGVITAGEGVFHAKTNFFLGPPLIEAASLESELEWVGVAFGNSVTRLERLPIPPNLVQLLAPPTTEKGKLLATNLVLDWPRIWRATFSDSAITYLSQMDREAELDSKIDATIRNRIQDKYEHAAIFYEYSHMRENWDVPVGWTRRTVDDVFKDPSRGMNMTFLHETHLYEFDAKEFSIAKHLRIYRNNTANFRTFEPEGGNYGSTNAYFRPSPNLRPVPMTHF
jgi:hypothetical protein